MQLEKNSIIELKINSLSNDGNGIGRHEGMAIFVAFSAPGDELKVKIVKVLKNHAFGIIDSIIKPSPLRQKPHCEIFGKCGGCDFGHITYEAELFEKQNFVKDALNRLGGFNIEPLPILPSPKPLRYRNKVQYPLCEDKESGQVFTGFYAARSHRVIPCKDCTLQPEIMNKISNYVCNLLNEYKISVYNQATQKGLVRHLYLRHSELNDNILLCFVLNGKTLPHANEICEKLHEKFEQICSIVININTENTNVILGKKCNTLTGTGLLNDELCAVPVALNPLSFYQVNTKGAEQLYKSVIEFSNVKKDDILLDLYCGAGTIGLAVQKATPCKKLIGVEIIPQAIENAKQNAIACNVHNAEFICADAALAAQKLCDEGCAPNVIILDPPRKGCDEKTLNAVLTMKPEKIVMVSCNAASAARDAKFLAQNGYELKALQPVDLFPRTKHVECICLFTLQ